MEQAKAKELLKRGSNRAPDMVMAVLCQASLPMDGGDAPAYQYAVSKLSCAMVLVMTCLLCQRAAHSAGAAV